MKRLVKTLILAICLVTASSASAQARFGVVGGLNLTKASFKDFSTNLESGNRAGWYIGPKVEFSVPIVGIGVDAAVEYSQRKVNFDNNTNDATKTYKSIEIPINVRYQFGLESVAAVYIHTGPQFSFNVGDKDWISNVSSLKWKSSAISWNVGAGVKFVKHLEVGINYNFAISKYAERFGVTDEKGSVKANSWQFEVAYLF